MFIILPENGQRVVLDNLARHPDIHRVLDRWTRSGHLHSSYTLHSMHRTAIGKYEIWSLRSFALSPAKTKLVFVLN